MRTRIYVAGPISIGILENNIQQATDAGIKLLRAGYAPFVPHLTCYMAGPTPEVLPHGTTAEDWYSADFPWVAAADAVLRLPGPSKGADAEVKLAEELGIPVFTDAEALMQKIPAEGAGDPRYKALLNQMWALHCKKASDYGRDEDPLANLRASEDFGIPSWLGALIRMHDKTHRLKSFVKNKKLANEGFEDTLFDHAAYCLLVLLLYREANTSI